MYNSPSVTPVTTPGESMLGCGMTPGGRFSELPASPPGTEFGAGGVPTSTFWAAAPANQPPRVIDDKTTDADRARI
ncbi:hypothetical protein GCM10009121_25230 [Rhodanobacter soli]